MSNVIVQLKLRVLDQIYTGSYIISLLLHRSRLQCAKEYVLHVFVLQLLSLYLSLVIESVHHLVPVVRVQSYFSSYCPLLVLMVLALELVGVLVHGFKDGLSLLFVLRRHSP